MNKRIAGSFMLSTTILGLAGCGADAKNAVEQESLKAFYDDDSKDQVKKNQRSTQKAIRNAKKALDAARKVKPIELASVSKVPADVLDEPKTYENVQALRTGMLEYVTPEKVSVEKEVAHVAQPEWPVVEQDMVEEPVVETVENYNVAPVVYSETANSVSDSETVVTSEASSDVINSEAVKTSESVVQDKSTVMGATEAASVVAETVATSETVTELVDVTEEVTPVETELAASEIVEETVEPVVFESEAVSAEPVVEDVVSAKPVVEEVVREVASTPVRDESKIGTYTATVGNVNTYPTGQCTWGVKEMAPWAGNYWGNGADWDESAAAAGFTVGYSPEVGAIASWDDGGYGHVAYVTAVDGASGNIQVMEANYNGNQYISNYRGWFDPTATTSGAVSYIYPN